MADVVAQNSRKFSRLTLETNILTTFTTIMTDISDPESVARNIAGVMLLYEIFYIYE